MASLPRQSDPEIKGGNRIVLSDAEHRAEGALGGGELFLLQVSPTVSEVISL